jgi:hypothetical protein
MTAMQVWMMMMLFPFLFLISRPAFSLHEENLPLGISANHYLYSANGTVRWGLGGGGTELGNA